MSERSALKYWGALNVLLLANRATARVQSPLKSLWQAGVPRHHSQASSLWTGYLLSDLLLPRGTLDRLSLNLGGNWARFSLQGHSVPYNGCHPPSIYVTLLLKHLSEQKLLSLWSPLWTVDMLSRLSPALGVYVSLPSLLSGPLTPEGQLVNVLSYPFVDASVIMTAWTGGSMYQLWLQHEGVLPKQNFLCFLNELERLEEIGWRPMCLLQPELERTQEKPCRGRVILTKLVRPKSLITLLDVDNKATLVAWNFVCTSCLGNEMVISQCKT